MSNPNEESTFRRRARKTARGIMLVNVVGTIIILVLLLVFVVWIASQSS